MVITPECRGEYIDIGLGDVIWKVCTLIMNNIIQALITSHNTLNGIKKGELDGDGNHGGKTGTMFCGNSSQTAFADIYRCAQIQQLPR